MSILVDPAIWPWRGDYWAHLISDVSEAELHEFAERLNLRRLSFQGDHYDVSVATRERALMLGAASISSRELVSRLRASGLRHRDKVLPWDRLLVRVDGRVAVSQPIYRATTSDAMFATTQSITRSTVQRAAPLISLFTRGTEVVVMVEGLDRSVVSAVSWPQRHVTMAEDRAWTVELGESRSGPDAPQGPARRPTPA